MRIQMIYLAAGNSRRFGSNKLYYEIKGKPMFRYGLEILENILAKMGETSLTVVTEYPKIQEYVMEKKKLWKERISLVGSPDREKGISYSIRAGLSDREADYYLFCVADQPWISEVTVQRLIEKTVEGDYMGGFVTWGDTGGNPAIFSKKLLPDLLALTGDTGGKKILRGKERVCTVQAEEERELWDIDREKRNDN